MLTLVLCAVALPALGQVQTYMEYQGTGGNLADASQWYVLTNKNDPSSYTSPVQNYQPYSNACWGYVRNGTTSTLNGYLRANRFYIGGEEILDSGGNKVPQGPSTVYIGTGASLHAQAYKAGQIRIGDAYDGTVSQSDGIVFSNMYVIGAWGATGRYEISGGLMSVNEAGNAIYLGRDGGTGIINQSGGTVRAGSYTVGKALIIGSSGNSELAGYGEYNLSDGYMEFREVRIGGCGYYPGGTGVFNQTGGTMLNAWGSIGSSVAGVPNTTIGTINLSGGTYIWQAGGELGCNPGGTGYINISGGMFIGGMRPGFAGGNGVLTMTGGSWIHMDGHSFLGLNDYSFTSGNGWGHLRLLGGYTYLKGVQVIYRGRITFNQDATFFGNPLLLTGLDKNGNDTYDSSMELIIADSRNFNISFETIRLGGDLILTLDGYTPNPGQQWRIFTTQGYEGSSFDSITDGFQLDIHGIGGADTPYEFYITYIPEPATMGLLALGALGMLRRRKAG